MAEPRIRIVVEAEDRNARRTILGVGDALTTMGSRATGIQGSLRNIFEFAGGQLVADGIRSITSSLVELGSQALDSYASYERLQMSLETFAARELINAGVTDNMGEAIAMSGERAQELLAWIEKLAVQSPFTSGDIASAFRLAQAYGFSSDQAMRLTQATVDFAAGAGISGAMMDRISLALGQIQARGKVSAQELNQLSEAGINARQILANAFNVSTAQITEMIEKGLVPANLAVEAITQSLEKDFGGAAQRQANTFSGLISSLSDIKSIGLREFFAGTFQAIQPLLVDFVSTVTDPAIKTEIRAWGDALGQNVAGAVQRVTAAISAFRSGGIVGLAEALQVPPFIIAGLNFAAQNTNLLKGAVLGLGVVLAGGALVSGLTALGGALLALASPMGLITVGAMLLGAAWTTNFGGIQEKTQAVLDFLRPGFQELLGWISAASQGDFAPLQAGLQGALQSVNATIQAFKWEDFVTKLGDWGTYIAPIAWDTLVTAVDWATYIGQLAWDNAAIPAMDWAVYVAPLAWDTLVTALTDWGAYIASLDWTTIITTALDWATWVPALVWTEFIDAIDWSIQVAPIVWSTFVGALDWATTVGDGITWADFISALDWTAHIVAFTWDSFITKLEWTGAITKMENWGTYITALDWTQLVVGALDWATWVPALVWNGFVGLLEWAVYLSPLVWSSVINGLASWDSYVSTLTWSNFIAGVLNWSSYITSALSWTSYVATLAWWDFVAKLDWPTFTPALSWSEFVSTVDWSAWLTAVEWTGFIVSLTWSAFIPSLSWASFINFVDLTSYIPSFPGWRALLGIGTNAAGTNSWVGGPTWVGEKGAELIQYPGGQWAWAGMNGPVILDLPAGTKIYSHEDSLRMAGGKMGNVAAIGMNADGTTRAPAIWPGGGSSFGDLTQAAQLGAKYIGQGGATAGKHITSAMKKATDELKSALRGVEGLFGASKVTDQQMTMVELGVPQNFADDWLRQLADEVFNGVDWAGVDIKDAALRAGIDPGLPAKAIFELVKEKWNDSSLFAGGKNTDLINQDAVRDALQRQADAKSGQQALYALFGITPEQASGQAVALGSSINAGVTQGMLGTGGQSVGAQFVNNLATGITPQALAPVATQITNGIVSNMAASGDKEGQAAGSDIGIQIANAVVAQLTQSDALTGAGQTILQKLVDSWATVGNIDIASKIASAMNFNLGTAEAIQVLQDVGRKIFKLVFQGYDAAASAADYVSPVQSTVNGAQAQSGSGNASATTTVTPPVQPATTTSGGKSLFPEVALAGAGGMTMNNTFVVSNQLDIVDVAYKVADIIQKRSRR